jgi:hypothetical protein
MALSDDHLYIGVRTTINGWYSEDKHDWMEEYIRFQFGSKGNEDDTNIHQLGSKEGNLYVIDTFR